MVIGCHSSGSSQTAYISAVAEIVAELVQAYEKRLTVNLSRLRSETSRRYGLNTIPTLVDIIAAIPEQHKATLIPYLRVKPIRSASGIAVVVRGANSMRCAVCTC